MQHQPFKRAKTLFKMLDALSVLIPGSAIYQEQLSKLPTYFSRGKSGKSAHKTGHKHMASVRKAKAAHNIAKRK
jgi:hypothetical protein